MEAIPPLPHFFNKVLVCQSRLLCMYCNIALVRFRVECVWYMQILNAQNCAQRGNMRTSILLS